jgi:hypothetical protein
VVETRIALPLLRAGRRSVVACGWLHVLGRLDCACWTRYCVHAMFLCNMTDLHGDASDSTEADVRFGFPAVSFPRWLG